MGPEEAGAHERVAVGPHAVGPPQPLAGVNVVGGHVAARAIFTAGDADDDLVIDDERGIRARLAERWIGVGLHPHRLASVGIDGSDVPIQGVDEDLGRGARGVGRTARDDVATGDLNGPLGLKLFLGRDILLREHPPPLDAPDVAQVDGVKVIGEVAQDVHHVADD